MSNETTLTTANDLVYAALINESVIDYARASIIVAPLVKQFSLEGRPGRVLDVPVWGDLSASGVNEGTDLSNTALSTDKVTLTASEVGVMITVTDLLAESDILANLDEYARQLGLAVADKVDSDLCALLAALNGGSAVGSTGVNMTDDNFLEALYTLEAANAPKPYHCVLHPRQWADLRADIVGATGTPYSASAAQEIVNSGFAGVLFGVNVYQTSNVPTANTDADRAGAMFSSEALALVTKWPGRTELQRDASLRATEIVVTACYGVGELVDGFGVPIVTDA